MSKPESETCFLPEQIVLPIASPLTLDEVKKKKGMESALL